MNDKLRRVLNEYNWDDGFKFPEKLLVHPDCDLGLALEIFYLADGYAYLIDNSSCSGRKEWKQFIEKLYADILSGRYARTDASFEIPLTKVQRYKLKTQQIPDVFITSI